MSSPYRSKPMLYALAHASVMRGMFARKPPVDSRWFAWSKPKRRTWVVASHGAPRVRF